MERLSLHRTQANSGYSLVELMVGIGIIGGAALVVSQFSTSFNSEQTNNRRTCESYTNSLIAVVSEETPYRQILSYIPNANAPGRVAGNFTAGTRAVPNVASYGPLSGALIHTEPHQIAKPFNQLPNGSVATAGMGPRLQSFQLIQGSIRSLAAIYNQNLGIRCQFGAYNPVTLPANSIPLPASLSLPAMGTTIRMRIDPYRISTGASLCPSALTQLFPGPPGITTAAANSIVVGSGSPVTAGYNAAYTTNANGGAAGDVTGYAVGEVTLTANDTINHRNTAAPIGVGDPDLGLRMYVQVEYQQDSQTYSCVSSQNFEYPADRTQPTTPNRTVVTANNSYTAANPFLWSHCGTPAGRPNNQGTLNIEVGYFGLAAGSVEPGVQFMCKDLSWVRTPNPVSGAPSHVPCYTRAGSPAGGSLTMLRPSGVLLNTTNNRQFDYTANKTLRDRVWVSCDRMRICGQSPVATVLSPGNPGNNRYNLAYSALPFGCQADFEAVAVDTAGNRSSSAAPRFLDHTSTGNLTVGTQTFRLRMDEIYHPTCGEGGPNYVAGRGRWCPPQANWGTAAVFAPNGYYTCRGQAGFPASAGTGPANRCCENGGPGDECRPWN